jgi:hypothetical protein
MSYEANPGQVQQNIKLLQEIEEQKRRIMKMSSSSPSLTSTDHSTIQNASTSPLQQMKPLNTINGTFGFFINTDSMYGNTILPVLPRF